MNINDYKDVNGQIENSKELIEDIVGAINGVVESGSNENGHWWKFGSGLLVCYQKTTYNVTFVPRGNVYGTNSVTWVFPTPFMASMVPFAHAYFRSLNLVITDNGIGNSVTEASFSFQRATSYTNNLPNASVAMVAIGRWE